MSFRDLIESGVTDAHKRNAELRTRHIKKPDAAVVSAIEEGKVNYAKASFAGDDGYGSGKAKWRQTDAAHKIDHDEVGAGEQGSHKGGSGLIKSKADTGTDKLALRQSIRDVNKHKEDQSSIHKFAMRQSRTLPADPKNRPKADNKLKGLGEEDLSEAGVIDMIKRKLTFSATAKDSPKEIVKRNKAHGDDVVKSLYNPEALTAKNSPAGLQARVLRGEMRKRGLKEGFVVKDHTGKPVFAHGADSIAKKKAEELTQATGNKHTVSFDREAHSGSIKENEMSFRNLVMEALAAPKPSELRRADRAKEYADDFDKGSTQWHAHMAVYHHRMVDHAMNNLAGPKKSAAIAKHEDKKFEHMGNVPRDDKNAAFHKGLSHHWNC